jgi:hypothetical protein
MLAPSAASALMFGAAEFPMMSPNDLFSRITTTT